jgi:hypothetical protein
MNIRQFFMILLHCAALPAIVKVRDIYITVGGQFCAMFERGVILCDMWFFCVLCLITVPLPPEPDETISLPLVLFCYDPI